MRVAGQDDEVVTGTENDEANDGEASKVESDTEGGDGEPGEGEESEDVVLIGDEEPAASEDKTQAPEWVHSLRDRYRELKRKHDEMERQMAGGKPATEAPTLPEKPKLADFDYDEEQFQAALDGWYAKKRDVDAHEAKQKDAAEAQKKEAEKVHENYAASKAALRVKDYQDAEDEVIAEFSQVQQSIVIAGAANPAAVVYALGKNPKKLKELASITNPTKFAVAIGKLETEVKVTKRAANSKPAPEKMPRGNTSTTTSTATLDRLRAEADKTGDRSKVVAYLKQQKQSGK